MTNTTKKLTTVAGLIAAGWLVGCSDIHGENFADDSQPTRIGKITQAQAATGAKEDAMLYDVHFHGSELTSLGEGKLDMMIKAATSGDPVKVYLNMPHDEVALRQAAVAAYLRNAGVDEKNIVVAEGPNPDLNTPTAYNLAGLYKQDGASYNGQAAVETAASSGMSGPASGGGH